MNRPFRILVVDDEPVICDLVRRLLGSDDVQVESTGSGAEAIELSARKTPDLVLLDVVLPGLDGLSTCRLLRARPEFRPVPIYMLTAKVKPQDHQESAKAGATGHIEKPFKGTELQELVHRLRVALG